MAVAAAAAATSSSFSSSKFYRRSGEDKHSSFSNTVDPVGEVRACAHLWIDSLFSPDSFAAVVRVASASRPID